MKNKIFIIAWNEIHKSIRSIIIYSALIGLLFLALMTMFDPELFANMEELLENYPEALKQMVGGSLDMARIEGFINVYVFTFSWMWFGIFLMIRTAQDIPDEIEKKTIDLVLSKPITRTQYVLGKNLQQILMIVVMMVCAYIGIIIGIAIAKGIAISDLNMGNLLLGFLWLSLLLIALESTATFVSVFLSSKKAVGIAVGIMIFFYFIGTFWQSMPDIIQNIKYLSLFHYFDTSNLLLLGSYDGVLPDMLVLFGYSLCLISLAIVIFNKRDLPV